MVANQRTAQRHQGKQCQEEVESFYRMLVPKLTPASSQHYHGSGTSSFTFIGLNVPQMRSLFTEGRDSVATLQFGSSEQIRSWDYVWRTSDVYEVLCAPLLFLGRKETIRESFQYWQYVRTWASKIENWPHSDSLCSFYVHCLYANPTEVYPELVRWNKSDNPWLQRISIVSLLYYSRQRTEVLPFEEMIPLVDPLLESSHPYVQKGVGWTLREIGNVYPRETYSYLGTNVARLAPVSYSYATEKLEPIKKERLAATRKKLRRGR